MPFVFFRPSFARPAAMAPEETRMTSRPWSMIAEISAGKLLDALLVEPFAGPGKHRAPDLDHDPLCLGEKVLSVYRNVLLHKIVIAISRQHELIIYFLTSYILSSLPFDHRLLILDLRLPELPSLLHLVREEVHQLVQPRSGDR